tara:strand:- start:265 stop:534 length:270 start_codon:yes stop_codon:yes gene_type:complete
MSLQNGKHRNNCLTKLRHKRIINTGSNMIKNNRPENLSKKGNRTTLTRRPLSEMEMIDLMIYGEDVLENMVDQSRTESLTSNNLRKQNV